MPQVEFPHFILLPAGDYLLSLLHFCSSISAEKLNEAATDAGTMSEVRAELSLHSAWLIKIKLLDKIGQDILKYSIQYSIQYKGMNRM